MSSNVEQIKEKLNIVDVISSYIKVEKAGINFKARCPFHNEKTPSFFISPSRQSFYCFGCGEKGDVFTFVEKFENIDFKETLKMLADRAGVKLEKFSPQTADKTEKEKREKEKLFEIMEEATKFFEDELNKNKGGLDYLKKRGLSENTIKKWRLGWSKDDWRNLHDFLLQKGFSKEEMLAVGLVKKTDEGKYYDTFRNRVMFPIFDANSKVIAFSGRAMKESEKVPKYLNSPETKLFYKSEVLYGFHIAKSYIRKLDYAVLVEGQMDLLMSQQAKVLNTVASSGTALTELHLKKIQKLSNRIILGFDSDSAGVKASIRAAELALMLNMEAKVAILPEGEDPASIILKDPDQWKNALKKAEHFTDFILNKTSRENEGRNLTKAILKDVLPIANLIKSSIEKNQFIKKIALKLRVREEDVWEDLKNLKIQNSKLKTEMQKTEEKSEKDEMEELLFEAEKYGFNLNDEKVKKEIFKKIELKNLKQKLQENTIKLDNKSILKEEEKKIKLEIENIQKQIKEFSNN